MVCEATQSILTGGIMAKFSPEFNKEIYRTVRSFNQRVRRAEQRGLTNLPDLQSVAELKARYVTENDMKRELGFLRQMNLNRKSLDTVTTLGGAKMTEWEFQYMKQNLKPLRRFYDVMIKVAQNRYGSYPYNTALKSELLNLEARRDYLNRDLNALTRSELLTFRRYMTKYKETSKRTGNYFDQYLSALGEIGKYNPDASAAVKRIRKKINNLSPAVFEEIYRRHDIVNDLFDIVVSPPSSVSEETEKTKSKSDEFYNTQDITRYVNTIDQKLDGWIEEAEAALADVNLEGLTEEEIEIYLQSIGKK